ncbi:MAG: hypothetical protein HON98_01810 [Chloroflexi bacterium]|nr:hypothetical protein [Chloroflexota bacterium]MBT3670823.1 hypothetical protein [Chloroflexota bacterium]MBT4002357.1 hypothetical protein [Chloroflexota bacterium]MBT4305282.1 hypothetical protein [Chloroflexota bacterium]MBT4532428.1 hypothetical protein [Chloroflexota bacterium]
MRNRRNTIGLNWFSIVVILVAIALLMVELIAFSRSRITYPLGLRIGGVPVGNLNRQASAEKLLEVYNQPIELHYNNEAIHLNPATVGFELNLESMLAAADLTRTGGPFWSEFWDYLWASQSNPRQVPLDANFSESQLRTYLSEEISPRYDLAAIPPRPIAGSVDYAPGVPGTTVDIDIAIFQIENALKSPNKRLVTLTLGNTTAGRPSFQNLEILLKQTVDLAGYDGIAGTYLLDLQTGAELHFAYQQGIDLSISPDVPFSAISTIKIPIMISTYRRLGDPPAEEAINLLSGMITASGNDPADWVMEQFIDEIRGPLEVTSDMQALGLENTFLAGYFRLGSPLLARYETPANSRIDVDTDLDPYNQTTLSDMGTLLSDLYQCEQYGGGALVAVFPNEITQSECRDMVTFLTRNDTPFLIEAGTPEGTRIAHKHGWASDNTGAIRTMGDAGIVYTPSGDYVLVFYFYHPVQIIWDPVSTLIGDLSRAIYNYYNLP